MADHGKKYKQAAALVERGRIAQNVVTLRQQALPFVEELAVRDQHLYLHLPNGMGRARLPVVLEPRDHLTELRRPVPDVVVGDHDDHGSPVTG